MPGRNEPFHNSEINKNQSGISLKLRLLLFLIVLVLTMVAGAIIILLITGIFSAGIKESRLLLEQELNNKSREISVQLEQLTLHSQNYASSVKQIIEERLEEQHNTYTQLNSQPDQFELLLDDLFSETLLTLQKSGASGVFIIFSTPASTFSSGNDMPGVYIKNEKADIAGNSSPSFLLLRGSSLLEKDYSVMPHKNWSEVFNQEDLDSFHIPIHSLKNNIANPTSNLFYLSDPLLIPGTSERAIYCIVPVLSDLGEIYAYCGFELSEELFQTAHLPSNIAYPRLSVLFSKIRDDQVDLQHSLISTGKFGMGLLPETMNLNVIKNPSSFYQYHSQENTEFLGLQKILPVYPESSPYYQEQPFCIVLVPKQDIISTITEFNILLIVLLLLLVLLGIVISIIFSNHYLKPISQSIELIRSSNEEEAPKTNILELDGLLSYLTDYKKQLQQKAEQDKHKISCLEQFADHAKSLTPAEHCVFQLYIQKLTAKEIAEKLCLSINTIKTHTKHIFSKLEISSREELLLYINMLEEIGYDLNTLNLSATDSIK